MNLLIVFLGPSGAGKSTTRRSMCGKALTTSPYMTVYEKYTIVGTHRNGGEKVTNFYDLHNVINTAFGTNKPVILDTVRISKGWDLKLFQRLDCVCIVVYFNVDYKVNLQRIKKRRNDYSTLPESTIRGNKKDRIRTAKAAEYFSCTEHYYMEVDETFEIPLTIKAIEATIDKARREYAQ